MLRRLIVNADDFGLSSGVNRAVEVAWQNGILTQASLMPGGDAFDEAVVIAKANPELQVGLHLTLVQGRAVLSPEQIPGLVDADGFFSNNPVAVGMRLFFDRSLRSQLFAEIEAQILKIKATGLPLSHIDGHLNIQMHPTVFELLTELMPRHGIYSFRITRENLRKNLAHDRKRIIGKSMERVVFGMLSDHAEPQLHNLGIISAEEVKGLLNSGRMTESYLLSIMDHICPGVTEAYFHPGCLPDPEIKRRMPTYHHEDELKALTSQSVIQKIRDSGIVLCNYRGEVKNNA